MSTQLLQKGVKWPITQISIFAPRLNTHWITVGLYERVGYGDTRGGDYIVCGETAIGVRRQSTQHHETQKTIPKTFDGQLIGARTKFRLGLK